MGSKRILLCITALSLKTINVGMGNTWNKDGNPNHHQKDTSIYAPHKLIIQENKKQQKGSVSKKYICSFPMKIWKLVSTLSVKYNGEHQLQYKNAVKIWDTQQKEKKKETNLYLNSPQLNEFLLSAQICFKAIQWGIFDWLVTYSCLYL